ncbi:MAG: hypothetical protein ACREKH_20175 [Candidatus Rokuibacteriota bacterium]
MNRWARIWAGAALVWACVITAAAGVGLWVVANLGQEREERICDSFDRFGRFLGHEFDLTPAEVEDGVARMTVELDC